MTNDTERRDVARRMREEAAHGEMHIRDFLGALCACIKTGRNEYRALLRLADLIEPTCDRDALLELADEIEIDGAGALDDGDWCKPLLIEYAHRIREALGVSDG